MDRASLVPPGNRLERLFLLDLLRQRVHDLPAALDAEAFLGVTPENLYAFVHSQLSKMRDTPAALLNKTAPHYRRNVMLELRRAADLRRLDATLTAAGIPYLVLKGPILAHTAYPDPATRTMLDLDLLLRDADLERAMTAVAAIGYSVPEHFAGWELNAGDAPPMIDNTSGSAVLELHTMLDSIPHDDPPLDAVWARARRVAVGHSLELPTLDDAEFFIHVVMHLSRHHRFEGELRSLLDVDLLLRSGQSTLDWQALDDECQRRGISEWIVLTIALAEILLGSPVPDIYKNRHPSPEALVIAAEQLWATDEHFVPTRITQRLAGAPPAPMFHGTGMKVESPSGLRFRAHREWKRVRNAITALRTGGLRPRNVAKSVDLYVKRERLFALLESERPLR